MYLIFLALWIIFNGKVTLEIVLFGLVIAAALDFFVIKFMDYRPQTTLKAIRLLPQMLLYFLVLLREIFKANIQTTKLLYSAKYEVEPLLVTFRPGLKTDTARVVLANSITLTPGTITVTLEGDEFVVHCLDKELADGIENSVFVALLRRMEGMV
ncbi:MAG: Na+/H+ antiporter subunit E [Lachnospiraceae bacterium]|jgi:multicomponent Na+:H+ antiporter subunit E|nr:Na+/H+ antiporter subunit E [Lachnospiraceae bacterium]MCX4316268.1 Na+/H+ antiporter subunit E [Lachnospiraceae bacterium]